MSLVSEIGHLIEISILGVSFFCLVRDKKVEFGDYLIHCNSQESFMSSPSLVPGPGSYGHKSSIGVVDD